MIRPVGKLYILGRRIDDKYFAGYNYYNMCSVHNWVNDHKPTHKSEARQLYLWIRELARQIKYADPQKQKGIYGYNAVQDFEDNFKVKAAHLEKDKEIWDLLTKEFIPYEYDLELGRANKISWIECFPKNVSKL